MPPRINIPPITRALLIALLFQSFLSAAIRYRQWTEDSHIVIPYLTLVPQLSLVYPWTFLTSALVEGNIFTLAISGLTLYHGGRYLERAWSSADLAKFLVLVTVIPNVLTFLVMVLFFTLTRNESWTYVYPLPTRATNSCGKMLIALRIQPYDYFWQRFHPGRLSGRIQPAHPRPHRHSLPRHHLTQSTPNPASLHGRRDNPVFDAAAVKSRPLAGYFWLPHELDISPILQEDVP
jgi:hypothetical protein